MRATTLVISFRFFLFPPFSFYARRGAHTLFPDDRISHLYTKILSKTTKHKTPPYANGRHVNKQIALADAPTATLSHDVFTIYGNLGELLHGICTFRGARKTPSEFSSSRNLTHTLQSPLYSFKLANTGA